MSGDKATNTSKTQADKSPVASGQAPAQEERYRSAFQQGSGAGAKVDQPVRPAGELSISFDNLKPMFDPTPLAQQQPTLQLQQVTTVKDIQQMLATKPSSPATSFSKTPSGLQSTSFQKQPVAASPVQFADAERVFATRDGYPVYAQGSMMPWAGDTMGRTSNSMGGFGCAVSSVAMAVSGITGKTVTPGEMNAHLNDIGGYNGGGAISKWGQMGQMEGLDVQVKREEWGTFNADRIDQELAQGRPVVVQVDYKVARNVPGHDGSGDHWILVTGRDANGQYLANDPMGGRMITLHRNADGQLTSNEPPPGTVYTEPYVTTGNATTFNRGAPAGQAGTVTTPGSERIAPIPMPAPDRAKLAASVPHLVNGLLQPSTQVESAITQAVNTVGTDYGYMKAMGFQESTFNPAARAGTSSAAGLYQFTEQTWLGTLKKHGTTHGMGELAEQIQWDTSQEKYVVTDAAQLKQILERRTNPVDSALMAAELAQDNQTYLTRTLGIQVGPTELYMAHFLGAGGAGTFLGAQGEGKGDQAAATFLPSAAKANQSIFYDPAGTARTLDEVYDLLKAKIAPNADAYNRALNPS